MALPVAAALALRQGGVTCSLREGAIQGPVFDDSIYMASGFFDNHKKLSEFTKKEMDLLLYGQEQKFKIDKMNRTYLGVITGFTRSYIERDLKEGTLDEATAIYLETVAWETWQDADRRLRAAAQGYVELSGQARLFDGEQIVEMVSKGEVSYPGRGGGRSRRRSHWCPASPCPSRAPECPG